jgi:predicted nucleotidyltransferase
LTVERDLMTVRISPEAFAEYRETARRREADKVIATAKRREDALLLAEQASLLLRHEFGACEVRLFGSLAHGHWFSLHSDIDLAVRGVSVADFFIAVARLQDLSSDFKIDLVDLERCSPALRAAIEQEGILL